MAEIAIYAHVMTLNTTSLNPDAPQIFRNWGFWAVIMGGLALICVFAQIIGPMLEPKPSVGTQIGEIAGDIKRSAWNSFLGKSDPAPEPEPVSKWLYLAFAAPILGVIAIVLSVISGVQGEHRRYTVYGAGLGVAAVTFQFFWWMALLIAGVMLLVAILENIGDVFSF